MADKTQQVSIGRYQIDMLKAHNWMPWKRQMLAILVDLGLDRYVDSTNTHPESAKKDGPTTEEKAKQTMWDKMDAKAWCQIKLAIGDAKMVHILGARTAYKMWTQLCMVRESKGQLGILATPWALFRATAEEGCNIAEHIAKLCQL
jgi:hypothetical protein